MRVGIHGIAEGCSYFGILKSFDDSIGVVGGVDDVTMIDQLNISLPYALIQ